ncbi:MAG: MOSC domain-containing protein [Candidatus Acidiferrum sp.]
MTRILHLFRAPKRRAPMEELLAAEVVENAGFAGCAHARPNGKRQVLLVDVETLLSMNLTPGIIRENITTEGLDVNALRTGQRLNVGAVELVVSAVCEPCELMDEIRPGLQEELVGRRGTLCRVVRGGMVRAGDEISVQHVSVAAD